MLANTQTKKRVLAPIMKTIIKTHRIWLYTNKKKEA